MLRVRTVICAFTACLALAGAVSAQDNPVPAPSPTPGPWTGSAQVSFLQTTGNTDTSVYGLGAEAKYKSESPWSFLAKGFLNRGSVNGTKNLKNLGLSLRGARALDEHTDFFVEAAYFEDFFAGIDSRVTGEAGLSRKLSVTEPHLFAVEAGFGLAHETRVPNDTEDFAFARGGCTYKWVISKTADFQNQANVIANLKDGDDWRFTNLAALTSTLRTRFSLKISYGIVRLNTPPIGKKKTDTIASAALVAKF